MPFVDTHLHLQYPDYEKDREEVLNRSRAAGVEYFINVGTDVASSKVSLDLANQYKFVYAAAGIHPNDCAQTTGEDMDAIAKMLPHPKVVAIGEIGLDYYREHAPKDKQKEVLRSFLQFYKAIRKPLVIHCRDAYEDLEILLKEEQRTPYEGVMHCYSSDTVTMQKFLKLGFHISFAGPLTYKKNEVLREACKACPKEKLLFETDAPYLPPQSKRGQRNESAYMLETMETAAQLHGISLEELGRITTLNAKKLFGLSAYADPRT